MNIEHQQNRYRAIVGTGLKLLSASLFVSVPFTAVAQDRAALAGACYARAYDRAHMAGHPGQRVAAISVQFQSFEDSLLAGITYRLRYGPKFGVSGDCHRPVKGGLICDACGVSAGCKGDGGETFKILWDGGETIQVVNDTTGIVAENAEGGKDRLAPGGAHGVFALSRAKADDCAW